MFDRLCNWLMYGDHHPGGIVVPRSHLEAAIRAAAKAEGREREKMPYETGTDYEKRMGCSTQKV